MCQCHSLPISEPIAHGSSLIVGLLAYGALRLVTVGPETSFAIGGLLAVLVNFVIGCKLNLIMLDILGALVGRPISAILAVKLLAFAIRSF